MWYKWRKFGTNTNTLSGPFSRPFRGSKTPISDKKYFLGTVDTYIFQISREHSKKIETVTEEKSGETGEKSGETGEKYETGEKSGENGEKYESGEKFGENGEFCCLDM